MERENGTTSWVGIQFVSEERFRSGGDVEEGERSDRRRQLVWEPLGVLSRLRLDAAEGVSRSFGFDHTDRFPAHEQKVIRKPVLGFHRILANGDARTGIQVHFVPELDDPARLIQRGVNQFTCLFLRVLDP